MGKAIWPVNEKKNRKIQIYVLIIILIEIILALQLV